MNIPVLRDFQRTFSHSLMDYFSSNKSFQTYSKYVFIIIIIISASVFLNFNNILKDRPVRKQTRTNAFIITTDCNSTRFTSTKQNIERVFPDYFTIHCYKHIAVNDSRIHPLAQPFGRKLALSYITFGNLWMKEIPKYSTNDDLEWSFVFEDAVNFVEPSNFSLSNYIDAIQELMRNPQIQLEDGMFYLGICNPSFVNNSNTLISSFSNNSLISRRGFGHCAHAMALTTKRAKTLWTVISMLFPFPLGAIDEFIYQYCRQTSTYYYILGANEERPSTAGHHGIAFPDREHFSSLVI